MPEEKEVSISGKLKDTEWVTKPKSMSNQPRSHQIGLASSLTEKQRGKKNKPLQKQTLFTSAFSVLLCGIRIQKGKKMLPKCKAANSQ